MINKTLASLAFATTLGLAGAPSAEVYSFGSVADFTPYNYLNNEGIVEGFEADLANLICTTAAISCEWVLAPWDEMIPNLLSNDIDVIMTGMQITPEREILIDFTQEYFPADPSAFMAMLGGTAPAPGAVVGAMVDTLQATYVSDNGWTLATYASVEEAIYGMAAGEVTAIVADEAYLADYMATNPGQFSIVNSGVTIGGGIGLGVRGADTALVASLDAALTTLKSSGQLDTLIGTWFDGRDPNYRGE